MKPTKRVGVEQVSIGRVKYVIEELLRRNKIDEPEAAVRSGYGEALRDILAALSGRKGTR